MFRGFDEVVRTLSALVCVPTRSVGTIKLRLTAFVGRIRGCDPPKGGRHISRLARFVRGSHSAEPIHGSALPRYRVAWEGMVLPQFSSGETYLFPSARMTEHSFSLFSLLFRFKIKCIYSCKFLDECINQFCCDQGHGIQMSIFPFFFLYH